MGTIQAIYRIQLSPKMIAFQSYYQQDAIRWVREMDKNNGHDRISLAANEFCRVTCQESINNYLNVARQVQIVALVDKTRTKIVE